MIPYSLTIRITYKSRRNYRHKVCCVQQQYSTLIVILQLERMLKTN